jgi:hypothetical protein
MVIRRRPVILPRNAISMFKLSANFNNKDGEIAKVFCEAPMMDGRRVLNSAAMGVQFRWAAWSANAARSALDSSFPAKQDSPHTCS